MAPREMSLDVLCNLVYRHIIALCPCHDGLCGRYDIAVLKLDVFALGRRQQGIDDDFDQVIPLPDDGRAHASYHGSDRF